LSSGVALLLWLLIALQDHPSASPWIEASGRLTNDGREALALLARAPDDGLDPRHYRAEALAAWSARLSQAPPDPREAAAFSADLDAAVRRFFRDRHGGRIDPRAVGFRMPPHPAEDIDASVRAAVAAHRLAAAADELAPSVPLYRELRAALARYRVLAADPALRAPALSVRAIRPGDRCAPPTCGDLPALRRLLAATGDLPASAGAPADDAEYDAALVAAVQRFQARHGVEPDGVIGTRTRAALRVPLALRARQIEMAMERLRWLPDRGGARLVGVNIPMFRLWAVEGERASFSAEVIVGRAVDTRTPVFVDQIEQVIFRPYWNVPSSILRNEILPALARDPAYLRKHDMEYVRDGGGVRVRQRPGPSNALGLVKFAFPNTENVYMHGTPVPALFERARRDFSHGCIRVSDPVGLAEWLLAPEGWTRERIVAAMHGTGSTTVTLARPVRVVLFYMTALVEPGGGAVHFAEDIYGHDAVLLRALEGLRESGTAGNPPGAPDPSPHSRHRRPASGPFAPSCWYLPCVVQPAGRHATMPRRGALLESVRVP
jgi:murein L,D-transpeptidase YcbB/YkuD